MSGHGGSREGSGRKSKYVDYEGNPLPTKRLSVPEQITEADIQELIYEKTKEAKEAIDELEQESSDSQ
ncbi:MAG: hypothetical protein AAGF93_05445 [Cyanobacteria bacterium P01_H01_bin.105]